MTQLNELRQYYAGLKDEYLLELAREADTLTPEALTSLQGELTDRGLGNADQEVLADQVGDFVPQHTGLISPDPLPTAHSSAPPARPGGSLHKAIRKVLVIIKISTSVIYITMTLFLLVLFVSPDKLGLGLSMDLNGHYAWRLMLLSSAVTLSVWAFLALRLVRGPGGPISANGLVLISLAYTVTFSLIASSDILGNRAPVLKWIWTGGNLTILWMLVIFRLRQVKFIRSPDLSDSVLGFLLLRSFSFDKIRSNDSINPISAFLFGVAARLRWTPVLGEIFLDLTYDFRYTWTYESLLRSRLGDRSGSIAASLYNPTWKGFPPVSGTFIRVGRREDWRSVVKSSLQYARFVIVLPGESAGLLEELRFLRYGDLSADRILLLIPEDATENLRTAFAETLRGMGSDLSGGPLEEGALYAFNSGWAVQLIARGLETYRDAVLEIQAWSTFGNLPDTGWCEFDGCQVRPTPVGRCPSCGLVIDLDRASAITHPDPGPGFPRAALPVPVWEPLPSLGAPLPEVGRVERTT